MVQSTSRARCIPVLVVAGALAAACAPASGPARGSQTPTEAAATPGTAAPAATETESGGPSGGTADPSAAPAATETPPANPTAPPPLVTVTSLGGEPGPVPDELVEAMIDDLAGRLGISPADVSVVTAESVLWNDGSLGCPEKGLFYLQVLTPGYRVILGAQGREYDYRANTNGFFRLCDPGVGGGSLFPPADFASQDRVSGPIPTNLTVHVPEDK